jgi:hypothetical protein
VRFLVILVRSGKLLLAFGSTVILGFGLHNHIFQLTALMVLAHCSFLYNFGMDCIENFVSSTSLVLLSSAVLWECVYPAVA